MSPNEFGQFAPLAEELQREIKRRINETIRLLKQKLSALNVGVEVWELWLGEDVDPGGDDRFPTYQVGMQGSMVAGS